MEQTLHTPEPHGSIINLAARHIMTTAKRATYGLDADLSKLEVAEFVLWDSAPRTTPTPGMARLLLS